MQDEWQQLRTRWLARGIPIGLVDQLEHVVVPDPDRVQSQLRAEDCPPLQVRHRWLVATDLKGVARGLRDLHKKEQTYLAALAVLGDPIPAELKGTAGDLLAVLGSMYYVTYRHEEALRLFDQTLTFYLSAASISAPTPAQRISISNARVGRAISLRLMGRLTEALDEIRRARVDLVPCVGYEFLTARINHEEGMIRKERGERDAAVRLLSEAVGQFAQVDPGGTFHLESLSHLAWALRKTNRHLDAKAIFGEAHAVATEHDDYEQQGRSSLGAGRLAEQFGDSADAIRYFDRAALEFQLAGDIQGLAVAVRAGWVADSDRRSSGDAVRRSREVISAARDVGRPMGLCEAHHLLAEATLRSGRGTCDDNTVRAALHSAIISVLVCDHYSFSRQADREHTARRLVGEVADLALVREAIQTACWEVAVELGFETDTTTVESWLL